VGRVIQGQRSGHHAEGGGGSSNQRTLCCVGMAIGRNKREPGGREETTEMPVNRQVGKRKRYSSKEQHGIGKANVWKGGHKGVRKEKEVKPAGVGLNWRASPYQGGERSPGKQLFRCAWGKAISDKGADGDNSWGDSSPARSRSGVSSKSAGGGRIGKTAKGAWALHLLGGKREEFPKGVPNSMVSPGKPGSSGGGGLGDSCEQEKRDCADLGRRIINKGGDSSREGGNGRPNRITKWYDGGGL